MAIPVWSTPRDSLNRFNLVFSRCPYEESPLGVFFFLVHWGAQSLRKGPVCALMKREGETRYGSPFTQPLPCEAENSPKESDTVFRMKESQRMRWGVFFFLVRWGAQSLHKGPVCPSLNAE